MFISKTDPISIPQDAAPEDDDFEETLRWLSWLGHVELPDPGQQAEAIGNSAHKDVDWEGWQGYVEQRLAYCYS